MRNLEIKNIKSHPSLSLAKANASRDLQINFNQAEDALTIPTESRHDYKCGFATQSGRSMIEMLGVLAIIGVLSVGGIAGYSKAMTKYRINKTIEQITLIAGNARAFFAPQHNYDGLGGCSNDNSYCKLIRKAKLIPDEMWDDTTKDFKNVFGYSVNLSTKNRSTEGDKQAFGIQYYIGDNMETCIELLSYDWRVSGAQAIFIGGPGSSVYLKFPVAVDKAVEVCSEAISKNQRYGASCPEMVFRFDINLNSTYWSSTTWAN